MSAVLFGRGVAFEFPNGRELFTDLDFSLDAGLTALVGPNGVGKSTLARLLAGDLEPTRGVVHRRTSIALLAQREQPQPISVAEYLSTDFEWSLLSDRLLAGIDRATPCSGLSGGQWMRVRLSRALSCDFLILDEPTNDLDRDGRDAVMQFLREHGGGALLISHDRACLQLCDEVLELSNRGLAKFSMGWPEYLDEKERERTRLAVELERAKRMRSDILMEQAGQRARQEKRNRRGAKAAARGGIPKILAAARKRRAEVTTGRLESAALERATQAIATARDAFDQLKIDPMMYADVFGREIPAQKLVAEARGFNIRFKDWLYPNDLEFSWRGRCRVAVKGTNGSGKSTLLKALLGERFDTRGELKRGDLATVYIDQGCGLLTDDKSVFDNVRAVSSATESDIRNGLARFLFAGDAVFVSVSDLSGGERLRAALARAFLATQSPELLVLDEPTNNLDLANVEFLETVVSRFAGALVVVSHDSEFLTHCRIESELRLSE